MATINFYLDKPNKKGLAPIHLRINSNGKQIKTATGEKVRVEDFDKEKLQEYREEFTNNMLELSKEDKLRIRTKVARLNIGVKTIPNKPKTLSSSYKNNTNEILSFKKFDVLDGDSDE